MKKITLKNIDLLIDINKTENFYQNKDSFICECKDCINYTRQFELIKKSLNGLDKELGIDITKDVGIGMHELMPHDIDDHHLYVIPYYVYGSYSVKRKLFSKKHNSRIKHVVDNVVTLCIEETDYGKHVFEPEESLTIWLEFKTPLVTYEEITGDKP